MAITLIAHVGKQSGGADYTTSNIDTSSANFIGAAYTWDTGGGEPTLSDNKTNTWVVRTTAGGGSRHSIRIKYFQGGTVGAGHNFSITHSGNGGFGSLCIAAFSGVATTPFDVEHGFSQSTTGNTTIQPGSITPTQNNELIIAAWGLDDPTNTTWTVNQSFTITDIEDVIPGSTYGCVLAYLVQGALGATNPTFTRSNANTTGGDTAVQASFKAPAAGGGLKRNSQLNGLGSSGPFFHNPLGYHGTREISLRAYQRERAREHREFLEKVRRAA